MSVANGPLTAIGTALAALFLASANADPARTVRGSVEGGQEGEPVWIGVFSDEAAEGSWTQAAGASFEVALPPGERATLLVVSKNRLPHKFAVTAGSPATVAVRLAPGLALAGTVRSEDGARLADADITIEVAEGDSLAVPPLAAPRWRSDRRGGFQITGLRPGRHVVTLEAEGHVPLTLEDVQVRRGEDNRIEAELPIAHFIAGRVVDGNGDPVAGVEVVADAWRKQPPTTTTTGYDGTYRLGPLLQGERLSVFARSPGMGSTVHHDEVMPPREGLLLVLRRHAILGRLVDEATGAPVREFRLTVMGQGESWEHELQADDGEFRVPLDGGTHSFLIQATGYPPWFTRLKPPDGEEVDLGEIALAPARSVSGRVLDARTGSPISGAEIYRFPDEGDYSVWAQWLASYSPRVHTGKDGAFALHTLPQEAVRVGAYAPGYGRVKVVRLPPGVTHLDFELNAVAPGPVVVIAGSIGRADGTPVTGWVGLFRAADAPSAVSRYGGDDVARVSTSENGEFRIEQEGLTDGEYVLVAGSVAGVVARRTVVIRGGQSVEDVRLVANEGGWLRISVAGVMASEGRAMVAVRNEEGRTVFHSGFGNGTYRVSGIPDAAVVAATVEEGGQWRRLARRIRLDDGGEAATHFDFTPRSRLTGTVTADGQPLGGILLRVLPANPSAPKAETRTNHQGGYDVYGLAEGRHLVRTDAGHSFEVYVTPDTRFDVKLPAVSLTGVVRHAGTGRPISQSEVRLRRSDGYSNRVRTAADGSFRFKGLVAGEYVVSMSRPGFESLSMPLWIAGDEAVDLDLEEAASKNDSKEQEQLTGRSTGDGDGFAR